MPLIELRCADCGSRAIVDDRDLYYGEDTVVCPHCEQLIEVQG